MLTAAHAFAQTVNPSDDPAKFIQQPSFITDHKFVVNGATSTSGITAMMMTCQGDLTGVHDCVIIPGSTLDDVITVLVKTIATNSAQENQRYQDLLDKIDSYLHYQLEHQAYVKVRSTKKRKKHDESK